FSCAGTYYRRMLTKAVMRSFAAPVAPLLAVFRVGSLLTRVLVAAADAFSCAQRTADRGEAVQFHIHSRVRVRHVLCVFLKYLLGVFACTGSRQARVPRPRSSASIWARQTPACRCFNPAAATKS